MDCFDKQTLEAHNYYRSLHDVSPLNWHSGLAREAQAWAERLAHEGRLKHADTTDGENIFMLLGQEITGTEAVDRWYHEIRNYNFIRPGFQSNTGHFTQVIWKASKEFGVGKAQSADGKIFVVGRYRPAGNNMRLFPGNVFPNKGSSPRRPASNGSGRWDPVTNDKNKKEPKELYFDIQEPLVRGNYNGSIRNGQPNNEADITKPPSDVTNGNHGNNKYRDRWESNRRSREIYDSDETNPGNREKGGKKEVQKRAQESIKKWEQAGVNGAPPEQMDASVKRDRERNDRNSFHDPDITRREVHGSHLKMNRQATIEDRIKKFEPNEYRPKSRPPRPVSEPNISYIHADSQESRPEYSRYTDRHSKPARPKSAVGIHLDSRDERRDANQIFTTFTDGPRKTVVSSITMTLKGNEGPVHNKKTPSTTSLTTSSPKSTVVDEEIQPTVVKKEPLVIDFKDDVFAKDGKWKSTPESRFDEIDSWSRKNGPSSVDTTSLDHFQQQALEAHNYFRAFHSVKSLKWSHDLAKGAQAWAEKLARERVLKHSKASDIGENLAMFSGKFDRAGEEATNMWYEESECYNFQRPGYQSNTGHFTQLVWRDTRELGIGRAKTGDGRFTFVVGRYRPAGNVLRKFEENVLPQPF